MIVCSGTTMTLAGAALPESQCKALADAYMRSFVPTVRSTTPPPDDAVYSHPDTEPTADAHLPNESGDMEPTDDPSRNPWVVDADDIRTAVPAAVSTGKLFSSPMRQVLIFQPSTSFKMTMSAETFGTCMSC